MASSYEVDSTSDCVASSLGYHSLKSEQKAVIKEFVMGKDVFAIFPTDYSKSLCYACLPGVFDKLFGSTLTLNCCCSTVTDAILKYRYYTSLNTYRVCVLFSVYNYISLAQVHNARITRPFYFLKGRLRQTTSLT